MQTSRQAGGHPPPFPADVDVSFHGSPLGRMRSRAVGSPRPGIAEVVLVQGMGVADYLMPGLGILGRWTRAHLVELPGFAGSGEPPPELDVRESAAAVADWVAAHDLGGVVLAGHSSGTQVAARAAVDHSHKPEWRRAGLRRLLHTARVHLDDALEESVVRSRVPLLVIRGREDRIGTAEWGRSLAELVPDGEYVEVAGAHTFPWLDPESWSEPIRRLAARVRTPG